MYFGNKTIGVHLLRGILGFAAVYASLAMLGTTIWPSLFLLPAALYLLKGCPMCWTVGLIETIARSMRTHGDRGQEQHGSCCRSGEGRPAL